MPRKKKNTGDTITKFDTANYIARYQEIKTKNPQLLGKRLRQTRVNKDISQRDLTKGLFTSAYLSSIELGKTLPTLETLDLLADRLGETLDYFLRPATPISSNFFQGDLDEEKTIFLSTRQHLFQCEVAIASTDYQQAILELNQVEGNFATLDRSDQVLFFVLKANINNLQSQPGQALEELHHAEVSLFKETEQPLKVNTELEARFYLETGRANRRQGNNAEALKNFQLGLATVKAADNKIKAVIWEQELLVEVGETTRITGDLELAANYLEQALAWFSPDKQKLLAQTLFTQASEQAKTGDFQKAVFLLGQSREINQKSAGICQIEDLALSVSQLYVQLAQYEKAKQTALIAANLGALGVSKDPPSEKSYQNEFAALGIMAKISFQEKDFEQTNSYLRNAQKLLGQFSGMDSVSLSRYYQVEAQYNQKSNNLDKANEYYLKAIEVLEVLLREGAENKEEPKPLLSEIYFDYSQLLKITGPMEQAMEFLERAYKFRFT